MNRIADEPLYRDGRHYDIQHKYLKDDIEFYLQQAKQFGQPVLELACGTGRITVPIAQQGFKIIGMDVSEGMLARAKEKAIKQQLKITLLQMDIRKFDLKLKFRLIIFPFNSIAHLHDLQGIDNCFKSVRAHLHDEGRFVLDFFNPNLALLIRDNETPLFVSEYPDPDSENMVIITETNRYDKASQINYIKLHYRIGDRKFTHDLNMRIFYPQELDALLHHNGFIVEDKYGAFDKALFTSDSEKQIVVCKLSNIY